MSLEPLRTIVMHHGLTEPWKESTDLAFDAMFGADVGRYSEDSKKSVQVRANPMEENSVPFAALIEKNEPGNGPYGGMSIAIFPVSDAPCLLTFVVGTRGLAPDDRILGRPGHARKVRAICTWLNRKHGRGKRIAWAKQDPTLDEAAPSEVVKDFPGHGEVFGKYGKELYGVFSSDDKAAVGDAVTAFMDLMIDERGGALVTKQHKEHAKSIRAEWMKHLLPEVTADDVQALLHSRRFVVIQGPPGTGKSRMAEEVLESHYGGNGKSIQFHPNTTYENFVGGLAPVAASGDSDLGFRFAPLAGHLMEAVIAASADPTKRYLLHIDEINRADLSKVLGEAIYLFEVKPDRKRKIDLPYEFSNYGRTFSMPENLDVLGTMNTADRSLAILDIAVRRRFAFVDLWPQLSVVTEHGGSVMEEAFTRLSLIFTEHANETAFNYMPGHAYFLEKDDVAAARQLQVTLVPLLKEYLEQGYAAGFSEAIRSYIQWLQAL